MADANYFRQSLDSISSASTTSLVFERLGEYSRHDGNSQMDKIVLEKYDTSAHSEDEHKQALLKDEERDIDEAEALRLAQQSTKTSANKKFRRLLWILGAAILSVWLVALVVYLGTHAYRHASAEPQ